MIKFIEVSKIESLLVGLNKDSVKAVVSQIKQMCEPMQISEVFAGGEFLSVIGLKNLIKEVVIPRIKQFNVQNVGRLEESILRTHEQEQNQNHEDDGLADFENV